MDLFTVPTHYLVEDDEDYHTFHPSRLMGLFDIFNADSLIDLMSGLGAPKRKILVSVPASAYKFILKDQDDNAPRSSTEEMQPVIIDQKQVRSQCHSQRTLPTLYKKNTKIEPRLCHTIILKELFNSMSRFFFRVFSSAI